MLLATCLEKRKKGKVQSGLSIFGLIPPERKKKKRRADNQEKGFSLVFSGNRSQPVGGVSAEHENPTPRKGPREKKKQFRSLWRVCSNRRKVKKNKSVQRHDFGNERRKKI